MTLAAPSVEDGGGRPTESTKSVVLVSVHYFASQRKAGFHWLAEAYWRMGWDVTFVTASLSWLSVVRKDRRLVYPVREEANRLVRVRDGLASYVLFTHFHPANLRSGLLNRALSPVFRRYGKVKLGGLEARIAKADLIVFESTPGLLLFERFREVNPGARFVYRVSDDLRLLRSHPLVIEVERDVADHFDLVSVPSPAMQEIFPRAGNLRVQLHAVEKELLSRPSDSPYEGTGPHAVFVGNSYFDHDFIERASRLRPSWTFHIIGPVRGLSAADNIVAHGPMPFGETVPYIQHADAGLHTLCYSEGAESLSDSLKVLQYSYCGLGVVAPDFMRSARPNVFAYKPGNDESVVRALESARQFTGQPFDKSDIRSWDELAEELASP